MSIAASPISRRGWRTVVSGGLHRAASGMSSKPTTETSAGTARPRLAAAAMVLSAVMSLAAKIAVGGSESERMERASTSATWGWKPVGRTSRSSTGMPRVGHRLPEARLAQVGGLQVLAPAEEADAPVTHADEVRGGQLGPGEAVGIDGGDLRGPVVGVDGDDGNRRPRPQDRRGDEDRAVDERAAEPSEGATLPPALAATGEGHEVVAGSRRRVRHAAQEAEAEGLELREEDAQNVGPRAPKAHRAEVSRVPEFVDHLLHARDRARRDAVPSVRHLGDRRERDSRPRRDIGKRHARRKVHAGMLSLLSEIVIKNVIEIV